MQSQESLAGVFVALADTLVAEFDLIEFLHGLCERCGELLGVDAVGLLMADPHGQLQVMASTGEEARVVELFQVQQREGPCLDCHRTGQAVAVPDIAVATERWPRFAPACRQVGFAAVHAIPMRCREQVIGALNLFHTTPAELPASSAVIAQAMADVATIGLLTQRAIHDQTVLIEQLQTAMNTRVVIEQAKGVLGERLGMSPERAFALLRRHARDHNQRLTDLARAVIAGAELPAAPAPGAGTPTARRPEEPEGRNRKGPSRLR